MFIPIWLPFAKTVRYGCYGFIRDAGGISFRDGRVGIRKSRFGVGVAIPDSRDKSEIATQIGPGTDFLAHHLLPTDDYSGCGSSGEGIGG